MIFPFFSIFIPLINLVEFMLSISFPRSLWFFLQVVTIMGITSNLSFNFKGPSKYPKVFMTDPSNWQNSNLLFCKVGFLIRFQKLLGISVTSCPVYICISKSKLAILTFIMFFYNFFLHSCFFLLKRLAYWFNIIQHFSF